MRPWICPSHTEVSSEGHRDSWDWDTVELPGTRAMNEPPTRSRTFRYALLFVLGMTEVMPPALVVTALPAVMRRNGASLEELGLLSLAMIPWGLKALWAPF